MADKAQTGPPTRRAFLSTGALATGAVAATALAGFHVGGKAFGKNQDRLRVGVVGCGGRGRGAAEQVMSAGPNVEVVALGDVFQESIDKTFEVLGQPARGRGVLEGFKVTRDRCFLGLEAYKQVIDSGIDLVLLCTPPGYRPEQFEYAVRAGKHIFCEKPVATDPVGIRRVRDLDAMVRQKGLAVLAGFQRRHEPSSIEAVRRIQAGDLGEVTAAYAYYNTADIWYRERKPGMSDKHWYMDNWYHVDWMSGDHIVEQHVHDLDVVNWVLGSPPRKAYGMGGRQYHTDRGGNIYDHFAVEYEYPSGVRCSSFCRQIAYTDSKRGSEFTGTKGFAYLGYNEAEFKGGIPWRQSEKVTGHQQEQNDLINGIRSGNLPNDTQLVCDASLTAILGREAAYTGKVVTWEDMAASTLCLVPPDLTAWDGTIRPVAKPGMARA